MAWQLVAHLQPIISHHLSTLFSIYQVNTSLYFSLRHSHNQPSLHFFSSSAHIYTSSVFSVVPVVHSPLVLQSSAAPKHWSYIQSSWYAAHNSNGVIHFCRTSSQPSFQIHITLCSTPTTWLAVSIVSDRSLTISIFLQVVWSPAELLRIERVVLLLQQSSSCNDNHTLNSWHVIDFSDRTYFKHGWISGNAPTNKYNKPLLLSRRCRYATSDYWNYTVNQRMWSMCHARPSLSVPNTYNEHFNNQCTDIRLNIINEQVHQLITSHLGVISISLLFVKQCLGEKLAVNEPSNTPLHTYS